MIALTIVVVAVVFGAMDFVWLGYIARDLYFSTLQPIMTPTPRLVAMILFYCVYVLGLVYFVVLPFAPMGVLRTAIHGALLGAFAYSVYDLTNLATLAAFTWKLAITDIIWGGIASASASAAGAAIVRLS